MEEVKAIFADAERKAQEALDLASRAEVVVLSRQVVLKAPGWRVILLKEDLAKHVGQLEHFSKAMVDAGFVIDESTLGERYVHIGISDVVKQYVDSSSNREEKDDADNTAQKAIEEKYEPAIFAYKRAKEAFGSNESSQKAKAVAFILRMRENRIVKIQEEVWQEFGMYDAQGVIENLRRLGLRVVVEEINQAGFAAMIPEKIFYCFEADDQVKVQRNAYQMLWPDTAADDPKC